MLQFSFSALIALSTAVQLTAAANNPVIIPIPYNDNAGHGPDGPWNYITLNVGESPISSVDFYPLFLDHGNLLITQNACPSLTCLSPAPNYYNPNSKSAKNSSLERNLTAIDGANSWTATTLLGLKGDGYWSTAQIHNPIVFNTTLTYVSSNITQGLGKFRYSPVSLLSLEPFVVNNKTKMTGGRGYAYQNTLMQSFHSQFNGTQSFGLHIGSAKFNQSGSLYLSGYDENRLVEKPAIFNAHGPQQLKGLTIGNSDPSLSDPWNGSLQKPPSNILDTSMSVYLSPQVPHLMFPQSVCEALTQFLPVKYDQDTNLYFWETDSPTYKTLISSPNFHLDFTWGDNDTTTIKVPFALLDLTLTKPIADTPTQYFPCEASSGSSNLGRAFLQAAILMQSYDPDTLVLGQAPGPSVNQTKNTSVKAYGGSHPLPSLPAKAPKWEDTWAPYLNGTISAGSNGSDSSSSSSSASSSSGKLTAGGIAGIIVAAVVALAFAVGILFVKRKSKEEAKHNEADVELPETERKVSAGDITHLGPGNSPALQQYMNYAGGHTAAWQPPRPPRPPSDLARLE